MGYDSNGFNFQGESILNTYNTDITTFQTKSSGFSKNGTDIATLITPAITGGRGTESGDAYKGFSGQITFDNAFSSQTPSKPLLTLTTSTSTADYSVYKTVEFRSSTDLSGTTGSFQITFSKTLDSGSASTPGELYKPVVNMSVAIVGGGGSGGASSWIPGAGGGGGAAVKPLSFTMNNDTTMYIRVGSGAPYVTPQSIGKQGYSTLIWGTSNDFSVEVPGGGGGGHYNGKGERLVYCGSTGGAGAEDDINTAQHSHELTTTGSQIHQLGNSGGAQIYDEYTPWDDFRYRGGHDVGYGWAGGGGGGAGSAGGSNSDGGNYNRKGGNGGNGVELWGKWYGGGGGGSPDNNKQTGYGYGAGGTGGGRAATNLTDASNDGFANTGGGGGAGEQRGGAGGSGVVRLLYRTTEVRTS